MAISNEPREEMSFDIVIVGAGPAGLSAAIRLKQLNSELSVVVLEKGAEVGAHIISGAVIDPIGLDKLLPDWRNDADCPLKTKVTHDSFVFLTGKTGFSCPTIFMPPLMSNARSYVGSLSDLCKWLATQAESLGVEIYPGFTAAEVLFDDKGAVAGVATGDMGLEKDGTPGPNYQRGMALLGRYTLFGEGARGYLSQQLIERFDLDAESEPQKYGIGIKEIWRVAPEKHQPGHIQHTMGWPLDNATGGGGFIYHYGDNLVAIGMVVHLNYKNPYLSPFEEFQRLKLHPQIKPLFEGAERISYGARALTEGGFQSVPKLSFAGGALIGCSAGFMNLPRIKGSHNAVLSGIQAAEAAERAIKQGRSQDELRAYSTDWRYSEIGRDLKPVRNVKPLWSRFGTIIGMGLAGFDMWVNTLTNGWSLFGTLSHRKPDYANLEPAEKHKQINYPKPDNKITFDRLSSVYLSNTNHDENEPPHLIVKDPTVQMHSERTDFAGPSTRYCPAAVYEWSTDENGAPKFVINAQNCVHCKTCDIKDPNQNIEWTPPQGGEGPIYSGM